MFKYDNIAGKIKGLAKASFIVEAIGCVIGAIAIFSTDAVDDFAWLGVLLLLVGPLVAWVGSWLLYGFGVLIENSGYLVASGIQVERVTTVIAQDTAVISQKR